MTQMNIGASTKNHASSLIIEDHLKQVLSKTAEKAWKASDNKHLPRSLHSPFGDFPADYMKSMKKGTAPAEAAVEAKQRSSKSKFNLLSPLCSTNFLVSRSP